MNIDLVLGLGNPGERDALTRHNVGFRVVEELLVRRGAGRWLNRPESDIAVITPGRLVALARPLNYMNRSGEVARSLLDELDIASNSMLVVVDDLDLTLGALRLRRAGGPGTHNGLRDICREVGEDFPRLRIGVAGNDKPEDLADWVTSPFSADEIGAAESAIARAADAVSMALREGFEPAMNIYNRPSP